MINIYENKTFTGIKENGEQVEGVIPDDLYQKLTEILENEKSEKEIRQEFIDEKLVEMTDEEVLEQVALVKDWKPRVKYTQNELVKHESVIYRVIKGITAETNIMFPSAVPSEFEDLTKKLTQEDGSLPVWVQPLGTHDSYKIGDKVQHKEKEWECVQGNAEGLNTWEPGVYGWKEIV